MEEAIKEILKKHESNVVKYTKERDERMAKMRFMQEHGFKKELEHLNTQKEAVSDIFLDYREAVEQLRKLLNDWNS